MKKIILAIGLLIMVMMITANYLITVNAKSKVYSNASILPRNKVGLVLGTKKLLKNVGKKVKSCLKDGIKFQKKMR